VEAQKLTQAGLGPTPLGDGSPLRRVFEAVKEWTADSSVRDSTIGRRVRARNLALSPGTRIRLCPQGQEVGSVPRDRKWALSSGTGLGLCPQGQEVGSVPRDRNCALSPGTGIGLCPQGQEVGSVRKWVL